MKKKNEKQVDTLVNTVRIFSNDIGIEFGISKCAMLVTKRGKMVKCEGIKLLDNQTIKGLEEGEGYKYLGILEGDYVKHKKMKENVSKEYLRRVRKILKSKLNGVNIIKAMNSRAVSIVRDGAGIVNWTKAELRNMNRKTRKLMTIYRALHPQADTDTDGLYMKREDSGRGMIDIEDCVEVEIYNLRKYLDGHQQKLLKAVKDEEIVGEGSSKQELNERRRNREDIRNNTSWKGYIKAGN